MNLLFCTREILLPFGFLALNKERIINIPIITEVTVKLLVISHWIRFYENLEDYGQTTWSQILVSISDYFAI